ncbi:MAG: phosphoglycerate dehydrogenase [Candidatus Palauibacterales bacterium]|nr:phosphoglycerate dehydrogenase [Candidatus Palauibacterales bacterium]MDP2529445.1 phosphoglycerate dehydrogenase [Candidatus Palauibacterales bacterium]MDP2584003.1 phosphoglycerate dehydrogenase [Candidatus Palauibacterales bacterium]
MPTKALLTESIHAGADAPLSRIPDIEIDRRSGAVKTGVAGEIADRQLIGIRSRTHLDAEAIGGATELLAIGCFCIGTNQVDLEAAAAQGVPVFNAPFANTRSVAELTLASAVMLLRRIPEKSLGLHRGEWLKTVLGAHEARAKNLGIIGYGNIGSQLSVLASGLGMHVYYYDIEAKLSHGNARAVGTLEELLGLSDVVTLHVPSTELTHGMIDARAIDRMKPGACLINHARGDLVDIDALCEALGSGHLSGAAIDVYPDEPGSRGEAFASPLLAFDNVLLTPHIGGSTVEAQESIGGDVAAKLARYVLEGVTRGSVNVPELDPGALREGRARILSMHRNAPGFLSRLNELVSGLGLNVAAQHLETRGPLGYAATDVEGEPPPDAAESLGELEGAIRTRVLRGG